VIDTIRSCVDLLRVSWRTNPGKLALAFVLMVAQSAALPLAAPALGALIDAALARDIGRATLAAGAVALAVMAALTAGHFAHVAYFELGEENFLRYDRELIDLANGSAGLEHHERPEFADKLQVLRQETDRMSWVSMQALLGTISLGIGFAITAVLLGLLNPWLLLLPLAAVPPMLCGRRAEILMGRVRESAAEPARIARHLFSLATDAGAAKELRVCRVQADLRGRHETLWLRSTGILWRGELRAAAWRITGQLVFAVAYVGATLLVVYDAVSGQRTVGDVVLAITLAAQVNHQVSAAVTLLQELQRLTETLNNFRWIRELTARQAPPVPDAELPERLVHGIRLRDVTFTYPDTDHPVLCGVDLLLPAGSTVAIVGENGAGKTTLVKLLCRFYEATSGVTEVDGVNIRRFPLDGWRERIAAGFQDFARFEFLARETVGVGDLGQIESTRAVTGALERAHAADVIARLDDGLETQLGQSFAEGAELSGGQWQKLALGRAMMRQTPLLVVLDEPTSALDAQAEHELFERYAANARQAGARTGAITLLVSHRFSTVRMADVILVVAGGRVAEAGSHEDLVAADGLYAELYGLQAAQYT